MGSPVLRAVGAGCRGGKILWHDRAVEIREGMVFLSRAGVHDDFDVHMPDKQTAYAFSPGLLRQNVAGPVLSIEQIADVLLIRAVDANYVLHEFDGTPTLTKV